MKSNAAPQLSQIAIDVGLEGAGKTLLSAIRSHKKHASNIQCILVHTRSSFVRGGPKVNIASINAVACALSEFPSLQELKLELEDQSLPIDVLAKALKAAARLQSVVLDGVHLQGGPDSGKGIETVLAEHQTLQSISFRHCRGCHALLAAASASRTLQTLSITSSSIAPLETTIQAICHCSNLRSLTLEDIPDLQDRHILLLGRKLASFKTLKELTLISHHLGTFTGAVVTDFLLRNKSIENLTLRLGNAWETSCASIARVLASNTSLQALDLLVYGRTKRSLVADITKLTQTLKLPSGGNGQLKALHICLDLDPMMDESVESCVVSDFQDVLTFNKTLRKVTIEEYGLARYRLYDDMKAQLELNQTGIEELLQQDVPVSTAVYLNAMSTSRDSVNALFYCLSNNPCLFAAYSDNQKVTREETTRIHIDEARPSENVAKTSLEHSLDAKPLKSQRESRIKLFSLLRGHGKYRCHAPVNFLYPYATACV
mgnify:CR=1 FL=1